MSNKDVFKILLCSYGYDRNIKIETYHGDGGWIGYDVYAENKDGDFYQQTDCEDFMFHVYEILDYMKQNGAPFESRWWKSVAKTVCNDEIRESLTNLWDEQDAKTEYSIETEKPIGEWRRANDPCPSCAINKKDHWDDIHYNCELNHNHSCPIMLKFYDDLMEFRNEFMKTIPEFKYKPKEAKIN
jgi:hypothetical protein